MEPDLKRQLEEIHALARDNHRMLRTIRRHQIFGIASRVIVWVIVLILPLYFYQQYATTIGLPSSADVQKLINSYQAGLE